MGNPLMAEDMLTAGLINALDESVLDRALECAGTINKLSPLATETVKKNLKSAMDSSFNESMEREMYAQRFLGRSSDYKEGLAAFMEKREPQFTGN